MNAMQSHQTPGDLQAMTDMFDEVASGRGLTFGEVGVV